ncbi:MAG: MlrC C-terminal domain-containing protein [Geminicoccaceae bacterium]
MIAPEAVAKLAQAGVGAEVTLPLGGHATDFFEPLTVTGTVQRRRRRGRQGGQAQPAGGRPRPGRHLRDRAVTMLLTELRAVAGNLPEPYRALGVEPEDYQMVVVKTASNFQYFLPIASGVIRVDTRGPGQSDIATLPWQRQPRPVYPLDEIASWRG